MESFRYYVLLSEMTDQEAYSTLGAAPGEDIISIKKKYRGLAMKIHQQIIPRDSSTNKQSKENEDLIKQFEQIKAAWEHLDPKSKRKTKVTYEPKGVPPWQPDQRSGYNTIKREDFSDINYIKYKIWEEAKQSGGIDGTYFVQAFDGSFLRNGLKVYGNDKTFWLMGKAIAYWNSNGGNTYPTEAVIVTKENWGSRARIIYAKGKEVTRELWVELNNSNPYNLADQINKAIAGTSNVTQNTLF